MSNPFGIQFPKISRIRFRAPSGGLDLSAYAPGAPASWVPFSATSSWNKLIPASPTISASSAAIIAKITGWGTPRDIPVGAPSSTIATDFDHPVYFAKPSDPLYTIAADTGAFAGWSALQGTQIRIPNQARGASGSDSHIAVVDITNGYVTEFWNFMMTDTTAPVHQAPNNGGTIVAKAGARYSLASTGWLATDGSSSGIPTDAAGGSVSSGNIRYEEINAGAINHALRMVVKSTTGGHVSPANGNAGSTDPTNAPPCGARIQLNMSDAEINALGCTAYNKVLYKAMAHYGMYVTDTGSASWNVQLASTNPWVVLGQGDPYRTWAAAQSVFYDSGSDQYLWQCQDPGGAPAWASKLQVLDWTDPANF